MLTRKERTIDVYKNAGAEMRLFKSLGSKLVVDISKVLSASDQDMLMRALRRVDEVCSRAEDNIMHKIVLNKRVYILPQYSQI